MEYRDDRGFNHPDARSAAAANVGYSQQERQTREAERQSAMMHEMREEQTASAIRQVYHNSRMMQLAEEEAKKAEEERQYRRDLAWLDKSDSLARLKYIIHKDESKFTRLFFEQTLPISKTLDFFLGHKDVNKVPKGKINDSFLSYKEVIRIHNQKTGCFLFLGAGFFSAIFGFMMQSVVLFLSLIFIATPVLMIAAHYESSKKKNNLIIQTNNSLQEVKQIYNQWKTFVHQNVLSVYKRSFSTNELHKNIVEFIKLEETKYPKDLRIDWGRISFNDINSELTWFMNGLDNRILEFYCETKTWVSQLEADGLSKDAAYWILNNEQVKEVLNNENRVLAHR